MTTAWPSDEPIGNTRPPAAERVALLHAAAHVGAAVVGIVFLLAAYLKAIDPRPAAAALSHVVGEASTAVQVLLFTLILIEIAIGAMLLVLLWPRFVVAVAAGLLTMFTLWIAYLLVFDIRIDCGCGIRARWFFALDERWTPLARNMVLLAFLVPAVLCFYGRKTRVSHHIQEDHHVS
jgi:hypothetical protein